MQYITSNDKNVYFDKIRNRFTNTILRNDKKLSHLKIKDFKLTNEFGQENDIVFSLEIDNRKLKPEYSGSIATPRGAFGDNVVFLIERNIFLKHRWFYKVIMNHDDRFYYEKHCKQIDPSEDTIKYSPVLEIAIFVQKPHNFVTSNISFQSRTVSSLL